MSAEQSVGVATPAAGDPLLPRLCHLSKGPDGFGFHLHGERNKSGQFIRMVEPDSSAERAGLCAGDRLVEVNGENVEGASHQQVVSRIREADGDVRLLVVDHQTDERLRGLGIPCREELVRGLPGSGEGQRQEDEKSPKAERGQKDLRPRLCTMKKGPNGYGFNLHSEKNKPGQYIRAVDPNSPAEASGLKPQDRIIEVNKLCMEGKQHAEVVAAIKAGGDETSLLVVDPETDEFFKKCSVIPSQAHLTGPLPEPVANGEVDEETNRKEELSELVPESPPSTPELVSAPFPNDPDEKEEHEKIDSTSNPELELNVPLAVAKERARQKRSNKKAPPMDWSKKNELFSNL